MDQKKLSPDINHLLSLLIDDHTSMIEVKQILDKIHAYFHEVTNVSGYDLNIKHMAAVPTATGMALSLNHAALCLLDYKRTRLFLKGMVEAIYQKQKENPKQCINIFYAGCGPYAPFITLVAPLFKPQEVQFSLLEINQDALEFAKKIITNLDLSNYISDYYLADAVTFDIPSPETFHILFSETLDALLFRESYVPILGNMLPQLSEQITLIPENVRINLNLRMKEGTIVNPTEILQEYPSGTIFDVREALDSQLAAIKLPSQFNPKQFELNSTNSYRSMIMDTEVHIYDTLWLKRGDSTLTQPYEIPFMYPLTFNTIIFNYHLKPQIELKYDFQSI